VDWLQLSGSRVLIVGMARSGVAAAQALVKRGMQVTIYDAKEADFLREAAAQLVGYNVDMQLGQELSITPDQFHLAVISPGVPVTSEAVQKVRAAGIPIIGEVELAYRLKSTGVELAAITGTNGKTTTTALLAEILKQGGINSTVAGNIGVPLVSVIDEMAQGVISLEVSSFQLETVRDFRPRVSAILNITPDHLDRHGTMENYIEAKASILACQGPSDFTVLNYEDNLVRELAHRARSQVIYFSTRQLLSQGVFIENGQIVAQLDKRYHLGGRDEVLLRGEHNLENILCAVGAALSLGVNQEAIRNTLATFPGVRHRLEEVASIAGVLYINDSKGTNPDSTIKALQSFTRPVVLIAGGRHKGADLTALARIIAGQVSHLILVGEAKEIIREKVMEQEFHNIHMVERFSEAVRQAHELARPGDVVLLSPACASWDMFNNYEERGDLFCQLVKSLEGEQR
jgi:UDP-N-acetylmuramoylalanine--D-glutamate ligase